MTIRLNMKKIVLLAFVLLLSPLAVNIQSVKADGTVSGKVTGPDGVTPIAGAFVEALQQGDLVVSSTTTAANGNYSLSLAEGAYKMRASAFDYTPTIKPVVNITTGITAINFNLTRGQTLVFDEFTGTSLNGSKWDSHLTGLGAIGISNATWKLTKFSCVGLSSGYGGAGSAAITSKATATLDSIVIFEGRVSAYWEGHWYPGVYADYQPRGLRVGTDPNNAIEFVSYARDTVEARTVSSGIETVSQYLLPSGKMVGDYNLTYRIEATFNSVKFYVSNALMATHVTNIPVGQLNIYVGTSYDGFGNIPVSADYMHMAVLSPPAPRPPVASFTYSPTAPIAGRTVTFDASASYNPDGSIVSYSWEFGDGTMSSGKTATHTYTNSGSYTVTLTITDTEGSADTETSTLTIMQAVSSPFWMQWWFYAVIAVVIVTLGGAVYFLKKRKPSTPEAPT